jgi:hypothetical protein
MSTAPSISRPLAMTAPDHQVRPIAPGLSRPTSEKTLLNVSSNGLPLWRRECRDAAYGGLASETRWSIEWFAR